MINITKIYLVTNCYGDPNKVYIGKTINDSREGNHRRTYGKQITFDYIDEVNSTSRKYWKPLETYWIEQFRQWGYEVINKNKIGGSGPEFQTSDTKIKISQHPERGNKISQAQKGISKPNSKKPKPKEFGENISQNKERGYKISQTLTGMPKPEGFGEKISQSKTGIKTGPNPKISQALKGHKCYSNLERGNKISQSQKGISKPKPEGFGEKIAQSKYKPVTQYTLDMKLVKTYPSKKETEQVTGINIDKAIRGENKSAGGFIWKYKEN